MQAVVARVAFLTFVMSKENLTQCGAVGLADAKVVLACLKERTLSTRHWHEQMSPVSYRIDIIKVELHAPRLIL
jgi:hypothetical protein